MEAVMFVDPRLKLRKAQSVGLLDKLCEKMELTASQIDEAAGRYEGAGTWLSGADDPALRSLTIYLQGSTAIGTTVRPRGRCEHDVDLVAHVSASGGLSPSALKKLIGDRLKANAHYAAILEEMARCWRLAYANKFHLDITPSIPNLSCPRGGELVPDKALRIWKPSNPRGYRAAFKRRAALMPRMRLLRAEDAARADVEAYPRDTGFKGILRRSVQIAKRHRDVYFEDLDQSLAPLSVIITTLAALSYERCVATAVYESEMDVLCDVLRHMTDFIGYEEPSAGGVGWAIWNETTIGENFAEKWNSEPARAEAFFAWHARALADLEHLTDGDGLDEMSRRMTDAFGRRPVKEVLDEVVADVGAARGSGSLAVAPGIGLLDALASPAAATTVRPNTFFGAA
jgi:Second Messenger Oligonucleotide or Dinucleotide Synthetase domain